MASEIYYYQANGLNQLLNMRMPDCVLECFHVVETHADADLGCIHRINQLRDCILCKFWENQSNLLKSMLKAVKFAILQNCDLRNPVQDRIAYCFQVITAAYSVSQHTTCCEANVEVLTAAIFCKTFQCFDEDRKINIKNTFGVHVIGLISDFCERKNSFIPKELSEQLHMIMQKAFPSPNESACRENEFYHVAFELEENELLDYSVNPSGGILKMRENVTHIPEELVESGFYLKSASEFIYKIPPFQELKGVNEIMQLSTLDKDPEGEQAFLADYNDCQENLRAFNGRISR